jgi:DNA-directed RNA polymerase specialized sigma24 family protein
MELTWTFVNGERITVDVSDEWGKVYNNLRRREQRNNANENGRTYASLDCMGDSFRMSNGVYTWNDLHISHTDVYAAIRCLPEQYQRILINMYFIGFTIKEIAIHEKVTPCCINQRLSKAKKILRMEILNRVY